MRTLAAFEELWEDSSALQEARQVSTSESYGGNESKILFESTVWWNDTY